jgi:PAS domain S-box-containing protein
MKTNMALCQVLGGIALLLLKQSALTRPRRAAGFALAFVMLFISVLTLGEHLFQYDLGIDQLLAAEAPGAAATASPNRFGLPGATSLMLLGIGLLAMALGRRAFAPFFGLATCLINLFPAVGFLYRIHEFYGQVSTGIAWPTVVASTLLGAGLMLGHTKGGPIAQLVRPDAGGAILRRMLPAVIMIPLLLGFIMMSGQSRGLYDTAIGTGLLAIALILVFSTFLWRAAAHLSRSGEAEAKANESVRESESRLKHAQQIANVGSWEWNVGTGALWWSDQTYRQMGEKSGQFTPSYEAFQQRVHPEDRTAHATVIDRALEGAARYDLEFRIIRSDDEIRILHSLGEVVYGSDDRPLRMVGVCLDITERKQIEQENVRLASFPILNPDPIIEANLNGKVLYANPSAETLFPDLPARGLEHPYMADWEKVKNACLENAGITEREVFAGERWFLQSVHYLKREQKVRIYGRDISNRKQAEEETRKLLRTIQEEKDRLSVLIDSIQDEVWFADLERRFTLTNRSVLREFGLGSLISLDIEQFAKSLEIYRPDGTPRPTDEAPLLRALNGEIVTNEEEFIRIPTTGALRYRALSAAPVKNADGKIIGSVSVVRDITERKNMEDELRRSRAELEQWVQERTADLSRTVESLAREVAERMDAENSLRDRSDQLRRLASELTLTEQRERMRLAQVLHDGLQQLLVGAKFRLATLEHSQNIRDAVAEVSEILDDAIGTSRSLTSELSPPILKEGGLVPALEWLARWMNDKHGLMVALTVHDTIDPKPKEETVLLLFQSTRELLFNVVKHAFAKTANVELAQTGGEIYVKVEDEGVGFNPSDILGKPGNSAGFGLFSILERISLQGGRVEIDSEPGRGSRFKLIIPLATGMIDINRTPPEAQATASPPISLLRQLESSNENKIRIVLVDDHMVMRQGLAGLLRDEPDFQVIGEASDGVSALKLIQEVRPDVVLMDVSMLGMNGIDATRIIHEEMPQVRVIGLSMFEEDDKAAAMRDAGAVNYVTKSGPADALINAIRKSMGVPHTAISAST